MTIRVLLLRLQNRFLILLVSTVLFFTVNKEIAAIDESSSSVSCRAAGLSGWVVRRFGVSSTRAFLAAFLRSSRTPGSVPGPGERCGVRARVRGRTDGSESSRSLQIPTTFFIFLSYFSHTTGAMGEVLFFKPFGV